MNMTEHEIGHRWYPPRSKDVNGFVNVACKQHIRYFTRGWVEGDSH